MSAVLPQVATMMVCRGCGYEMPPDHLQPFRCPNAGANDDTDHILHRLNFSWGQTPTEVKNPFVRYRTRTHVWNTAMAMGVSDGEFIDAVRRLPEFRVTPLYEQHALARAIDLHADLWVKNETGNVGGSHKARHLMAIAIWLSTVDRTNRQRLAIASCGNAAIAATVLASAMRKKLDVYIPAEAQFTASPANVIRCERREGERGDPAYLRFREAIANGALPFSVQGNENALAIEGGETLGWELVSQLRSNRATLDRLFIQVGGGALASSVISAFRDAGMPLPRIHAVQTEVAPLKRAFDRVTDLEYAVRHRSEFMWPWETPGQSIATGILDDETYDWANVVSGIRESGGFPVIVSEERLLAANRIAVSATGIRASATGTAGLAGLMELQRRGEIAKDEAIGVIFTG